MKSFNQYLTEGAMKRILHDMGYFFRDDGKWEHEKTGKEISDKQAIDIALERASRKKKFPTREVDASGPNPTDKDARKQGDESTHSEGVEFK